MSYMMDLAADTPEELEKARALIDASDLKIDCSTISRMDE